MSNGEPAWSRELLDAPHDAADKAGRVQRMFNRIAPRYELINSLFSAGRDAVWRRRAVELAAVREDDDVLDVGCGTGDFARAFLSAGARLVVGCDFAHEMLIRAAGCQGGMGKRSEERAKLARANTEADTGKQVCPCHPSAR
ncbi:MAG: class I SAM-dependent methyltransferase, partial [Phycisphaerae bacterium]